MEARKIEIRRQKNRYQDNFSCQSSKLKIRNVANNYEKYIESATTASQKVKEIFVPATAATKDLKKPFKK